MNITDQTSLTPSQPPPMNPYQPPKVDLEKPVSPTTGISLLTEPNKLAAGKGASWVKIAWQMFTKNAVLWIGAMLLYYVTILILTFIPVLNLLTAFLGIFYSAGIVYMAHQQALGRPVEFGQLFIGFKQNTGQLILLLVLIFAFSLLAIIPMAILIMVNITSFIGLITQPQSILTSSALLVILLSGLVGMLFFIPLFMAAWLAPALIILHDLTAFEAMKRSFKACLRNILPFLVYGLVVFGLSIVAMIPLFLGFLVLSPVLMLVHYVAYRTILTNQPL